MLSSLRAMMFVSSVRIAYRCVALAQCRNPRQRAPGWSRFSSAATQETKITSKSLIGIVPLTRTPIDVLIAIRFRSFRTSRANCWTTSYSLDLSSLFPVAVAVCFSYEKSDGAASLSTPPPYPLFIAAAKIQRLLAVSGFQAGHRRGRTYWQSLSSSLCCSRLHRRWFTFTCAANVKADFRRQDCSTATFIAAKAPPPPPPPHAAAAAVITASHYSLPIWEAGPGHGFP